MEKSLRAFLSILWLTFAALPAAHAMPIHETYYVKDAPTSSEIALWSRLPGERSFIFRLSQPSDTDLAAIAKLEGADRLTIEDDFYPSESTVQTWKAIAARGATWVGFDPPVAEGFQIDRLNRIAFDHVVLVLTEFPGLITAAKLAKIQSPLSISFQTGRYPLSENKLALKSLPPGTEFLFSTNYWPRYVHMDLMNMLDQPRRIRVEGGVFPTDKDLEYLHNIRSLDDVQVETDGPAPEDAWKRIGLVPVEWISVNQVPEASELEAFAESQGFGAPRRLTIERDQALSPDERARLESASFRVEWVHAP